MAGYIGTKAAVVTPGAERKKVFSIATTTTSLTGLAYTPGFVHVFHNGVRLVDGTDYTATNGTSLTLTTAAQNGDEVVVISYATFQTSDTVSASAGGTFSNAVTVNGDLTVDTNTLFVDAANNRVGVGTTSNRNSTKLDVLGDVTFGANASYYGTLAYNAGAGFLDMTSSDGGFRWFAQSGPTERMRIDLAGRVTMPYQPMAFVEYGGPTVSAGAELDLSGGTVGLNVGNMYNSANGRYTVPVSGVYRLTMGSQGKTIANISAGSLYYRVNGGGLVGQTLFYGEAYSGNQSEFLLSLVANDYVQVATFGNNSVTYTHNGVRATFELVG